MRRGFALPQSGNAAGPEAMEKGSRWRPKNWGTTVYGFMIASCIPSSRRHLTSQP